MLVLQRMTHTDPPEPNIPSWSTGTDAEIEEALKLHYRGKIDLTQYWSIGIDERVVPLSAMPATYVAESHVAQSVTLILLNVGGKQLVDEDRECAFVVGQKNCLANNGTLEGGHINEVQGTDGGWDNSDRRKWCNEIYYNALPESTRKLFKRFKTYASNGSAQESKVSNDLFALMSLKEINNSPDVAESNQVEQFSYFKNFTSNKIKYAGDDSVTAVSYWTRSLKNTSSTLNYAISSSGGQVTSGAAIANNGICPFGVI